MKFFRDLFDMSWVGDHFRVKDEIFEESFKHFKIGLTLIKSS